MAIVGHGLIGLAAGGCVSSNARDHHLPDVWLGLMVLLAYGVDLAEWFAVIFDSDLADGRFVSHSPFLVAVLAVGVCIAVGVCCRLRRPWPYVIIVAVTFSHLLLDSNTARFGLAEWYSGHPIGDREHMYPAALVAECCVYGAPLVWVLLVRSAFERSCPRRARIASWVLVAVCVVAGLTRCAAVWAPVYVFSALHAVVALRRFLNLRLLWNLVPLLPLLALSSVTLVESQREAEARLLKQQGLYREAARAYQSALDIPTRSNREGLYRRMGMCYEKAGDFAATERAFRKSLAVSSRPGGPETILAGFYLRHPDTPFYRPERAVRLYARLLETDGVDEHLQTHARAQLRRLRER